MHARQLITLISLLAWLAATLMGFFYPGTDVRLGEVQRLFYVHFGTFYSAFGLFLMGVLAGVMYLRTRREWLDDLQKACLEVGLWYLSITILTGMFVARPVWGRYWVWDARLTGVAIMWLSYLAYFFLRSGIESPDQRRRFAAVYGVLAFLTVLMSLFSLQFETNLTTPVLDFGSVSLGLGERMGLTVWANIGAYGLAGVVMVWHLMVIARRRARLARRVVGLVGDGAPDQPTM